MAGKGAVRVLALRAIGNVDTRELASMLLNVGNGRAAHVGRDRMLGLRTLGIVLDVAANGHIGHAQDICQVANENGVVGKIAICGHRERRAIAHELNPVAVEDAAARGGCGHGSRAIAYSELVIIIRAHHLHAPELGDERCEHRANAYGKQGKPSLIGKPLRIALALGGLRLGAVLGIEREFARVAPHDKKRPDDGGDEDGAGYDNDKLGIHSSHPLAQVSQSLARR